jgi:DNA-binding transcriptional ArsR family regulator
MQTFEALSDPVRRRILELLNDGEQTSGAVTESIRAEFGISQPAVSQHLRVLRDTGLTVVRVDGARRIYTVNRDGLAEVDAWLDRFRASWQQPLDALATELARGQRRQGRADTPASSHTARSA